MRTATATQIIQQIRRARAPQALHFSAIRIVTRPHVYPPSGETRWLVNYLERTQKTLFQGARVLDYGTGSGSLAIWAARQGAEVVAVDANKRAIACASENAKRNQVTVDC